MPEAATPTLAEATAWVGAELGEMGGSRVGQVQGFYVDGTSGEPVWLIARLGRRRGSRVVAVPLGGCAGAPFGAWAAYEAEAIRTAPIVDPDRPLLRKHELAICSHYGISEAVGRAAAVARFAADDVTATPSR